MIEEMKMKKLPEPISRKNAASALVFGAAALIGLVMIAWRMLIE